MDVAAAVPLPGRVALAAAAAVGLWWSGVGGGAVQCRCVCSGEQGPAVLELLGRQLERCGPEQLHGQVCPEASGCAAGVFLAFLLGLALGVGATSVFFAVQRSNRRKELAGLIAAPVQAPLLAARRVPVAPEPAPAPLSSAVALAAAADYRRPPSAGLLAARRALQA